MSDLGQTSAVKIKNEKKEIAEINAFLHVMQCRFGVTVSFLLLIIYQLFSVKT